MTQTEQTDNPTADHVHKPHARHSAIFGLVILLAGVVIGAASTLILVPEKMVPAPPFFPEMINRLLDGMKEHLQLSEDQTEKLEPILRAHMEKFREIHKAVQDDIRQGWAQMNEEISALLTEEQRQKWTQWREDVQRRLRSGPPRGDRRRGDQRRGDGRGGPRSRRGPDQNEPRGPVQEDRFRGGPGWRPDDANRPRWRPDDPNRPRRDFRRDANRPWDGPDRFRRGPRPPAEPNLPPNDPDRAEIGSAESGPTHE